MSEPVWIKSTRSNPSGNCVEILSFQGDVLVRDSKDPDGPVLRFPRQLWGTFVEGVKKGEFDAS